MRSDPHRWPHGRYCDAVAAEIGRFAALATDVDPAARVPSCPDWTVADLLEHTGAVHRWVTAMVRDLATERLLRADLELGLPDDPAQLAGWLGAGATPLVETLRVADPDAPMWAWGADHHVRFWSRRMLHETAVHRVDGELAAGADPVVDAAVAVDGIDELLENLASTAYFRPDVRGLRGQGERLALRATDTGDAWSIALDPDGYRWDHSVGDAQTEVAAPAGDLLLLLYRRRPPDDVRFQRRGDGAVLDRWLRHSAL